MIRTFNLMVDRPMAALMPDIGQGAAYPLDDPARDAYHGLYIKELVFRGRAAAIDNED
jgi:hypothetical protein